MTLTVEPPPHMRPDAGVIEEARARQRRHRGIAGAVAIALAVAALLFAFAGGGGGAHGAGTRVPAGGSSATAPRSSSASCLSSGRALKGPPSRSLLSILGVLRRPATAADSPAQELAGSGLTRDVFARYIRRTQVIDGSPYYIYPAIIGGCGVESEREGIVTLETNIDLGHGLLGGGGGGGYTAADIEQGSTVSTGPPGSATSTTITMVLPDGVASVRLHLPAGQASGYSPKISPPFTITRPVIGNELVVRVPRSGGFEGERGLRMTWLAPDGRVLRRFSRF